MLKAKLKPQWLLSFIFIFSTAVFSQEIKRDNKSEESKTGNSEISGTNNTAASNVPEGVVRLRVTFLASGKVGEIAVVSGTPDELNQLAIEEARKLKFEPAVKDGVPVTVVKTVDFGFTLFYKEGDKELLKSAEISEMPAPIYPKGKNLSGKVKLTLQLSPNGKVEIDEVKSDLPKEFQEKAVEAASRIKFIPAIHKNGKQVTQIKEIEYEFNPEK